MYCAYIHCKPDGSPFYVGKGTLSRAHYVGERRNQYYQHIIKKYGPPGIGVISCSSEKNALKLEQGLIKVCKRMGIGLANLTDGGEGVSGYKFSRAFVEKHAAFLRGKPRPEYVRRAISQALTGKTMLEATKNKISAALTGRSPHPNFIKGRLGRCGKLNPYAKSVVGTHPLFGERQFDSLTLAAEFLQGRVSKISKVATHGGTHKGWKFKYG